MSSWPTVALGEVLSRIKRPVKLSANELHETLGVRWYGYGCFVKPAQLGRKIAASTLFALEPDDIVYSRLFAWKGSFAVVEHRHAAAVASNEFPTFRASERLVPGFFALWAARPEVWDEAASASTGTTANSRNRLGEVEFLDMEIPLPSVTVQRLVIERVGTASRMASVALEEADAAHAVAAAAYARSVEGPDTRRVSLRDVAQLDIDKVTVEATATYRVAGVKIAGEGLFERESLGGSATKYPSLHRLRAGQLVYRKLTAWEGPITVVPAAFDGLFVSSEFPTFTLDESQVSGEFMRFVCTTAWFHLEMKGRATGTAERRNRLKPGDLLDIEVDLPSLAQQEHIGALFSLAVALREEALCARNLASAIRDDQFETGVLGIAQRAA